MEANHRNHIKLPRLGLALISILITASAALAVEGRVVRKEDGTPVANAQVTIIGRAVTTRGLPVRDFLVVHQAMQGLVVWKNGWIGNFGHSGKKVFKNVI